MIAVIRETMRKTWARCGEVCGTRMFHTVMAYEEDGQKKMALRCPRCNTVTLLDIPFPTSPSSNG